MADRFYHGGVRRLHRGGLILPSSRTGAFSTADYGAADVCRRDRVYVCTDLQAARAYAAMYAKGPGDIGRGDVYEVEPLGTLAPDPDCYVPGLSWEVPMARVLRVVERWVQLEPGMGTYLAGYEIASGLEALVQRNRTAAS
jgi:hypothetical protein